MDTALLLNKQNKGMELNDHQWNTTQQTLAELVQAQLQLFQSQAEIKQSIQTLASRMDTITNTLSKEGIPQIVEINQDVNNTITALGTSASEDRRQTKDTLASITSTLSTMATGQEDLKSSMSSTLASIMTDVNHNMMRVMSDIATQHHQAITALAQTIQEDRRQTMEMLSQVHNGARDELTSIMANANQNMVAAMTTMVTQHHQAVTTLAQAINDDRQSTRDMLSQVHSDNETTHQAMKQLVPSPNHLVVNRHERPNEHPTPPRLSRRSTPKKKLKKAKRDKRSYTHNLMQQSINIFTVQASPPLPPINTAPHLDRHNLLHSNGVTDPNGLDPSRNMKHLYQFISTTI